jgi:hypothetical protein
MSGTLKVGGKTLATHDTNTNVAKIQLGSTSDVVLTDSAGNNVLSESGGTVTLTADEANVGSNALVVNSGLVGIGTSSPTQRLQVDGGAFRITGDYTTIANNQGLLLGFNSASDEARYYAVGANGGGVGEHVFYTYNYSTGAGSERMRIDSSGNVLVGMSSPINAFNLANIQASTSKNGLGISTSSGSDTSYFVAFYAGTSNIGSISTSNNTTTAYNTASDYRLKENITEITDGITRVKQLNPSRFNFITDPDRIVDGFIAHEVQDIVPEAITGEKDAVNEDGSINPQGIDQSKLVPLLTAALQEAIALIESQQSQIDALTARIEALETPAE